MCVWSREVGEDFLGLGLCLCRLFLPENITLCRLLLSQTVAASVRKHIRRGWSSRVVESSVVFLPTRPSKSCQLSFVLGRITLACLSLSAMSVLAQGRAIGSTLMKSQCLVGMPPCPSDHPPGGFLSEPGEVLLPAFISWTVSHR